MPPLKIRNTLLGEGRPKICVPIVGTTEKEILEEAGSFSGLPLDMVEWRADWFEEVTDTEAVLSVLEKLRKGLGETALLFTFRTAKEGGKRPIRREDYAAQSGRRGQRKCGPHRCGGVLGIRRDADGWHLYHRGGRIRQRVCRESDP